jgi:hypothetical protein
MVMLVSPYQPHDPVEAVYDSQPNRRIQSRICREKLRRVVATTSSALGTRDCAAGRRDCDGGHSGDLLEISLSDALKGHFAATRHISPR